MIKTSVAIDTFGEASQLVLTLRFDKRVKRDMAVLQNLRHGTYDMIFNEDIGKGIFRKEPYTHSAIFRCPGFIHEENISVVTDIENSMCTIRLPLRTAQDIIDHNILRKKHEDERVRLDQLRHDKEERRINSPG